MVVVISQDTFSTDNNKIINNINQLLHNKGIKQELRIDVLLTILHSNNESVIIPEYAGIHELLNTLNYMNNDLIQELFMVIGSKYTKYKLDQFYTPLTISEFIGQYMIVDDAHNAIDPAGGTGDLLIYYKGHKTIWDIDESTLKLCRLNYELNKHTNYTVACKDSLKSYSGDENTYSYVAMNPPFGSSTVITDASILSNFTLGTGKKKQEIGILFVELGIKLLKPNGIMFIILPSGYMGNSNKNCTDLREFILYQTRVIASLELPKNTYKRSGTGVNTYLLIVQKNQYKSQDDKHNQTVPHEILISSINNIGYNLIKKNTPAKYKTFPETGAIVYDKNDNPILDNDFNNITVHLNDILKKNEVDNMYLKKDTLNEAEAEAESEPIIDSPLINTVLSSKLESSILDIKRYKRDYLEVKHTLEVLKCPRIKDLAKIVKKIVKHEPTQKYKYIDIGEISSPFYNFKELYGWELPSRAKYSIKKYDILVSKLEGTISYCVILMDDDNYIATNGVTVIRPNDMRSLYILFATIMKKEFIIQHNAYLTGSIMASLGDDDVARILINDKNVDIDATKKMIDTLETLQKMRI